ncbi:MAG: helicase-related protein, partial [Halapricum sp.]
LDEVHLYTQLRGAHAAKVIDNVDTISDTPLLWLGSSATIDDASRFGKRIFGIDDSDIETVAPPDEDFDQDHTDKEHYYFMLTPEDGPGVSSMSLQQYMLLGHSLLESTDGERGKLLGFIDSISQVNQKRVQLEDADENRELWRYHTAEHGDEDWEGLAEEMGARFIEGPLDVLPVFSDHGFDSDEAAGSDVLLSTSFLEVGIDVGEIKIVTQYRTPWDLSSFLQRSGRAARKEGMDAHIAVFLSNLTDDANMFYRAERFLGSDIRTPLKTDNPVVEWIHGKFQQYYRRAELIDDERYWSEHQEHRDFLEGYLVDDLEWTPVHRLLTEPATFFEDRMDDSVDVPSEPLLSTELVDETIEALNAHLDDLGNDFSDIETYFDMEGGNVVRGEDAVDAYVMEVQTQVLNLVQTFLGQTQGYRARLSRGSDEAEDQRVGPQLEAELADLRDEAAKIPDGTPEEKLQHYSGLIARLYGTAGQIMQLRAEANSVASEPVPQVKTDRLDEVKRAVDQLDALVEDDRLAAYYGRQREVFYLKSALKELRSYLDGYGKPFMSLYSVKDLLRCAYYVDRYLRTRGDRLSDEVWFVPPDYYGSSGQFMTVFRGEDDRDGTEESIDKLVSTFTPYRSEYQAEAGVIQAFLPDTTVTDDGLEFAFGRYVTGQERDGVLVPDSIQMSEVTDLADAQALNIVRYCPVCLQIISDLDRCLRHDERNFGKIHADAQVSTTVTDRDVNGMVGGLSLADVSTEVTLDGVSLEITPAEYMGPDIGYRFTGEDRLNREISSPEMPLGFRLDTRGLVFDLSAFLNGLDEQVVEHAERYKDLDEVEFEYLAYHTASHFFLQLVADVSSVNTTNLLYGFDESEQEVYVFERTEGGQGIVDLVFEELRTDPASVLESIVRVAYNPQVLNERLWADRSFVSSLPEDGSDEDSVSDLVEQWIGAPYDEVLEQVTQECIATIDRCLELASDVGASPRQAYRIKSAVAREQIEGADEFSREEALEYDSVTEQNVDRIKTLFYSPDIDGCVENLQLTECMASGAQ